MAYKAIFSSLKSSFSLSLTLARHFQTLNNYSFLSAKYVTSLYSSSLFTVRQNFAIPLLSQHCKRDFHKSVPVQTLDRHHHLREDLQKLHKENDPTLISQDLSKNFEDEDVLAMRTIEFGNETAFGKVIDGVRFDQLPILIFTVTKNNTKVRLTDFAGNVLAKTTCGREGFENAKKMAAVASQTVGLSIAAKTQRFGYRNVRVVIKGDGMNRLAALKGVVAAGVRIVSLTDHSAIVLGLGHRPKKRRSV